MLERETQHKPLNAAWKHYAFACSCDHSRRLFFTQVFRHRKATFSQNSLDRSLALIFCSFDEHIWSMFCWDLLSRRNHFSKACLADSFSTCSATNLRDLFRKFLMHYMFCTAFAWQQIDSKDFKTFRICGGRQTETMRVDVRRTFFSFLNMFLLSARHSSNISFCQSFVRHLSFCTLFFFTSQH